MDGLGIESRAAERGESGDEAAEMATPDLETPFESDVAGEIPTYAGCRRAQSGEPGVLVQIDLASGELDPPYVATG